MARGPPAPKVRRFAATVTLALPPERVFAYLEDAALRRQWIAGLEEIAFDQPGIPRGAGTRFRQQIRTAGRSQEFAGLVTAYRPPQDAAIRLSRPGYSVDVEYRLAATESGTRVEQVVALTLPGWLALLAGRLAAWLLRRRMAQALARLKAAAEAGRASRSQPF